MTRHLLIKSLVASSLIAFGWGASALASPQRYADNRANFQDFQDAETLFSQVRADIDRAQHDSFPHFTESDSFERARAELSGLQEQWDQNRYTPGQADSAISALERVVDQDHMKSQDRGRLSDDLSKMRDFRASHQY